MCVDKISLQFKFRQQVFVDFALLSKYRAWFRIRVYYYAIPEISRANTSMGNTYRSVIEQKQIVGCPTNRSTNKIIHSQISGRIYISFGISSATEQQGLSFSLLVNVSSRFITLISPIDIQSGRGCALRTFRQSDKWTESFCGRNKELQRVFSPKWDGAFEKSRIVSRIKSLRRTSRL